MAYILGIDIGTGSTKAVAVNANNKVLAVAQYHYPTLSQAPGCSEQDPEIIWQAFKSAILEIHDKLGAPEAIGLSSAMHSLIPVDSQCAALGPMLTWADSRSGFIAEKIRASQLGKLLYEETGTPIYGMSPLFKIIWIEENQPSLFAETYKFISIKEYIWYNIFGEFKVDHSIASATGMFNLLTLNWHVEALQLAKINEHSLSEPVPTDYTKAGKFLIDPSLIAFKDAKFVIGASDGCLANLGSSAIEIGVAAVTIGTSGAVRIAAKKPILNFEAMTFNYILNKEIYICGGPVNNGGIALQWLLTNVFGKVNLKEADYEELFDRVEDVKPGSAGLLFLPYLMGERAPIWDKESCGTFFGLRNGHDQSHLSNAVLEGICYALNEVLLAVEAQGNPILQINVSGGFVKSVIWMQMLANITGKKVLKVQLEDASAIGAIILAGKVIGMPLSDKTIETCALILPDKIKYEVYSEYFALYKKLYRNLSCSMHELNVLKQK
ncbi:gluconokinase [Pedobacter sp. UYP24]